VDCRGYFVCTTGKETLLERSTEVIEVGAPATGSRLGGPDGSGAQVSRHHRILRVVTYARTCATPAPWRRFQSRSRGGPNFGSRRPVRRWRDRSRRRCAGSRNGGSNTPHNGPDDIQDRSTSHRLRNLLRRSPDRRVGCRPERFGLSLSLTYNGTPRAHRIGGSVSRRQKHCLRHGAQSLRRPRSDTTCCWLGVGSGCVRHRCRRLSSRWARTRIPWLEPGRG
jgi:hypothetical protein